MARARGAGANLLIIDGYEQLSFVSRLGLTWQLRRRGWGTIVTAHRDVGFPTLYRTPVSVELTQRVVARLLPDGDTMIDYEAIARCFAASGGNVRETLFGLYDQFEQAGRRPSHAGPGAVGLQAPRPQR
jgi:hypothetical protein